MEAFVLVGKSYLLLLPEVTPPALVELRLTVSLGKACCGFGSALACVGVEVCCCALLLWEPPIGLNILSTEIGRFGKNFSGFDNAVKQRGRFRYGTLEICID
jgi:hypothetical protein